MHVMISPVFSDLQRLYAAQAARKVDVAAESVKFHPQDVQVSGC